MPDTAEQKSKRLLGMWVLMQMNMRGFKFHLGEKV
jgi:hypothetical protein